MTRVKRCIILILSLCIFTLPFSYAYSQDAEEILVKVREATRALNFVKTNGKSTTGSSDRFNDQGVIDYANKSFEIIQKKGETLISKIYFVDGITYMYNALLNSWIKFGQDLNMFGDIFDKDKLFSFLPDSFEGTGFQIENLGEEDFGNQACYVLKSSVINKELAKKFMTKFLTDFTSEQMADQFRKNKDALDAYLESYIQNSESIQWVAKDTFFVVKATNKTTEFDENNSPVEVINENIYYDFNQPVVIELPQEAATARLITAADLETGE